MPESAVIEAIMDHDRIFHQATTNSTRQKALDLPTQIARDAVRAVQQSVFTHPAAHPQEKNSVGQARSGEGAVYNLSQGLERR